MFFEREFFGLLRLHELPGVDEAVTLVQNAMEQNFHEALHFALSSWFWSLPLPYSTF